MISVPGKFRNGEGGREGGREGERDYYFYFRLGRTRNYAAHLNVDVYAV